MPNPGDASSEEEAFGLMSGYNSSTPDPAGWRRAGTASMSSPSKISDLIGTDRTPMGSEGRGSNGEEQDLGSSGRWEDLDGTLRIRWPRRPSPSSCRSLVSRPSSTRSQPKERNSYFLVSRSERELVDANTQTDASVAQSCDSFHHREPEQTLLSSEGLHSSTKRSVSKLSA